MIRLIAVLMLGAFIFPAAKAGEPVQFGVLPSNAMKALEGFIEDAALEAESVLKRSVNLKTRSSYEEYLQALIQRQFEIALVQPFDFLALKEQHIDYFPILRLDHSLKAIFVVKDLKFSSLQDIQQEKIGFPPFSAAITILGVSELQRVSHSINKSNFVYFSEHRSCIQAVLINSVSACATMSVILETVTGDNIANLHVIHESKEIPGLVLIVRSDIKHSASALQKQLTAWSNSDNARNITHDGGRMKFIKTSASDFNELEAMYNNYYLNKKIK